MAITSILVYVSRSQSCNTHHTKYVFKRCRRRTNRHAQHIGADDERRRKDGPQAKLSARLVLGVVHGRARRRSNKHVGIIPAARTRICIQALIHAAMNVALCHTLCEVDKQDGGGNGAPVVAVVVDAPRVAQAEPDWAVPELPACTITHYHYNKQSMAAGLTAKREVNGTASLWPFDVSHVETHWVHCCFKPH